MPSKRDNNEEKAIIEDYMNNRMIMIASKNSVLDAVKTMAERNISSVVVTDSKNKIIGLLTERDIVKIIANDVSPDAITVGSLIPTSLVSVSKNSSVEEAAKLMVQKKLRHLLVENPDSHDVVGIVTTTDLARYLRHKLSTREVESMLLEAVHPSEDGEKLFWQ